VFLATGGALGLAIAAVISFATVSGIDIADAAISNGKSFIELMNQRSPGKRIAAQLIKTKGKHKYYRVLSEQREMPPPELYKPLVDVDAPPPETLYAAWPELPNFLAPPPPIFPPPIFFPCCGVFGPPGPPHSPPPPPGFGVPEPETWTTMVLGFGLIGWQMRRRRSRTQTVRR
jgi:hypothetical protein